MINLIKNHLIQFEQVLRSTLEADVFWLQVAHMAEAIVHAFEQGHKMLIAGNGGSAADAQHIAGELVSRFNFDRAPLPAIALTTDTAILTAIGNDYSYDQVFERQVKALGQEKDIFMAISTSGQSKNVLLALKAARERGMVTLGLTGLSQPEFLALSDHVIQVPSNVTPVIQEVLMIASHAMCEAVEKRLFG